MPSKGSSKLYPVYDKHKAIIKEMSVQGISKVKIHEELNLPGIKNTFRIWCSENNIRAITNRDIYSQNTSKILELAKEYHYTIIHKMLNLPGRSSTFQYWCKISNIPTLIPDSVFIKAHEKEIIKLTLTSTVDETARIIINKYGPVITSSRLKNYFARHYVCDLIEKHYPGEIRRRWNSKRTYDWDSIMIEAKIRPFNHISQKYGYGPLLKPCRAEFNLTMTEAFYNKFGYDYNKCGYIEQHLETIYKLLISNTLQYAADVLDIKKDNISKYLRTRYKGVGNFLDYFNRNPTELKFIMNRYDDVTEDMLADSIDE